MAASTGEWVASTTWVRGRRAISASSATRCSWAEKDSPASGSSMTNSPSPRNRRVPGSDTNDSPCDMAWNAGSFPGPGLVSSQVNSPCIVSARTK